MAKKTLRRKTDVPSRSSHPYEADGGAKKTPDKQYKIHERKPFSMPILKTIVKLYFS